MSFEDHSTPSEDGRMRSPYLTWNDIQGRWHVYKGKARQKWGLLTNEDVDLIGGYYEELSGKIQEVYNISREDAEKQIEEWMMGRDDSTDIEGDSNSISSV